MRKSLLRGSISAALFLPLLGHAQLINDGAVIKIQTTAVVFVAGNVENRNAGSISNDGKLEVQGNFLNTATYTTATGDDSLILSGGGNVSLSPGSSSITNLWINKSGAGNFVTITGTAIVTGKLDYDQGTLTTDPIANPSYLLSSPVAAVYDFAAGKEIIGRVRRTGWVNASETVFNQPNMRITTNGGTAPTDFTVTMIPQSAGGDPTDNEREVKRKFGFNTTGGTGYTTDIRYAYLDAELNTNTETNLVPWARVAGEWNGRLTPVTRDASNNFVTTIGLSTTDIAQEWKLADPRYTMNATVFLRGAWTSGPSMTTSLNSAGYIPAAQPYNVVPFSYTGTENAAVPNANVVDWVLVELRKPSTGLPADATSSTVIGRKAGFLLNNGLVVDLDGVTPLAFNITKQGAGFMVVRHRNHLAVMSVSLPSNSTGSFTNDFRSLANVYKNPSATSDPVVALPSSAFFGLWAGNANATAGAGNNIVNSTDVGVVKSAVAVLLTGYNYQDINLSGVANSTDVGFVKSTLASLGQSSASRTRVTPPILVRPVPENNVIQSSVPQ